MTRTAARPAGSPRKAGLARPNSSRYAAADLDDALVHGGHYERIDLGMNWWATMRWKLGGTWGRTWLVCNGLKGRTDTALLRLQWVY